MKKSRYYLLITMPHIMPHANMEWPLLPLSFFEIREVLGNRS